MKIRWLWGPAKSVGPGASLKVWVSALIFQNNGLNGVGVCLLSKGVGTADKRA